MTYKKKLIEVALPLAIINEHAAKQKSMGAAPHPQNLHRWWARRPLAATRAVLWASLVDDPSAHPDRFPSPEDQQRERERLFDILQRLVPWEASTDERILEEARAEIAKSCDGDLPKVLDPFGGGGAIPLEALRLGLPTYTGDLNPIAVLIQRAMLEVPARFANQPPVNPNARAAQNVWEGNRGLAADVQAYGEWMRDEACKRIGKYYPNVTLPDGSGATPIAWIWARTVKSPDPSWPGHVPLVRSWILAKKSGKPVVWVEPIVDHKAKTIHYEIREGGVPQQPSVERGNGVCVATGSPMPGDYIKAEANAGRMHETMLAVVAEGARRAYVQAVDPDIIAADVPPAPWKPDELVPTPNHDVDRLPMYGMRAWGDAFTPRQLLALTTFSDLLGEVRQQVLADAESVGLGDRGGEPSRLTDGGSGSTARADAIITHLAFVIDKCADYWSSICTWNAPNSQLRYTFSEEQIPMTWDFAEANPFSGVGGSWEKLLENETKAMPTVGLAEAAHIAQRDARARISEIGTCVISTDPPYYDNISYADLSDFFFVWLRRNLADVWPDECATLLTPKADEIIANQYRAGSKRKAHEHFESGMQEVFSVASANADERFPATIFYAFKATESIDGNVVSTGWETFLAGLLDAGYAITATWPIRSERKDRPNAINNNALASSIVLACRPREISAPMATRGEFVAALRRELGPSVRVLQLENIAPVDLAQSAMGPGIAIFSRYAKVIEADGAAMRVRTALALINEALAEVLSGEESEFDSDTRFALTWFEQYAHNPGPFGDADLLARAKDTTVGGVERAGIVASRDGKVRLVERKELPEGWDPTTDTRLTVWETTQHLIRALDSSETDAAALLARLGIGAGERARQLAYLLYGLCDRKKWAEEAGAYNTLVTAWPEISRLAVAGSTVSAGDSRLF